MFKSTGGGYYVHKRGRLRHRLGSGTLTDLDIAPGATNHLMFEAEGETFRFAVNGVEHSVEMDAEDLQAIEELIGSLRYYDTGKWHGYYNATWSGNGSRQLAITGGTHPVQRGGSTTLDPYPWVACTP